MTQEKGTTPDPTEGVAAGTDPGQQQETVAKGEYDALKSELEDVKQKRAEADRAITRLSQERPGQNVDGLAAQLEHLDKKLDLYSQQQGGQLNETAGTFEQQKAALDANYAQKSQAIGHKQEYQIHTQQALETIRGNLQSIGLDPDGTADEVAQLQQAFTDAANKGERMDAVVQQSFKVATDKLKTSETDRVKMKEEVRKELLEEQKGDASLKVDTGGPTAASGGAQETIRRYAEGDRSISRSDYEKAMSSLTK